MPRYDLNGNLMPDEPGSASSPPVNAALTASGQVQTSGGPAPSAYQSQSPPYQQSPQGTPYPATGPILPQASRSSMVDSVKVIIGSIVGVCLLIVGIAAAVVLNPKPVPVPSAYQTYTLSEEDLNMDQPVGWTVSPLDKSQGSEAVKIAGGVVFSNGSARIEIAEGTPYDPTASGVVGIAQLSNALSDDPAGMAASRYRRLAKNHLTSYRETNVQYGASSKAFKYGQKAEFTGQRWFGLGGTMKGYFATEADNFTCVAILCECRASDWNTLKPVFDRVINSLHSPEKDREEQEESTSNSASEASAPQSQSDSGSGDSL